MKRKGLVTFLALLMTFLLFVTSVSAEGEPIYTWSDDVMGWVFMQDEEILTNQWVSYGGEQYYVGEDGKCYENGAFKIGGAWYLFDCNGMMLHGGVYGAHNVETGDTDYYYAQEDGKLLLNEWKQVELSWYYFGADGKAYTGGIYEIGGKKYGFASNGVRFEQGTFHIDYYDKESNSWLWIGPYRAKEDASVYIDAWYYDDYGIPNYEYGEWYYYGADGKAPTGFATVGGVQYYFDFNGCMYKQGLHTVEDAFIVVTESGEAKAAANNQWTWLSGYWYYVQDGNFCCTGVYEIGGKKYGFDNHGRMYFQAFFEAYDEEDGRSYLYYAQGGDADGALMQNGWLYYGDSWIYFGAECKPYALGVYTIDGAMYGFNSDGFMYENETFSLGYWDEDLAEWIHLGNYRAKTNGQLYVNEWYYTGWEYGDEWYYYGADGKAADGLVTVGGVQYYFDDGLLYRPGRHIIEEDGEFRCILVDGSNVAQRVYNNTWAYADGYWHYVQNNAFCWEGVYEIGGKLYGFDDESHMYYDTEFDMYNEDAGKYVHYYAQGAEADGALLQNQWYNIDYYWTYYGPQGYRYENGIYQIGSKRYAFAPGGCIRDDEVVQDVTTGKYYYATPMDNNGNGGSLAAYTNVWKAIHGDWYYFTADSSLHTGWLQDKYYMAPAMYYATYFLGDDGYAYIAAKNGVSTRMTSTGFFDIYGQTVYVVNGKVAQNEWVQIGGKWYYFSEGGSMANSETVYWKDAVYFFDAKGVMANSGWVCDEYDLWYFATSDGKLLTNTWRQEGARWYYFDENGIMLNDGAYFIEKSNANYFFDANGIMANKGWVKDSYNNWYWAAASGKLFTGVDSAGYVFDEFGLLIQDGTCRINDMWYVTNANGIKIGSFNKIGWNQVGADWYYLTSIEESIELINWDYAYIEDRMYFFDDSGKLRVNQFYEDRYLNHNGDGATGWFKVNGVWYYGDPDDNGQLYWGGIYEINNKEYLFDNDGKLLVNTTTYYYGESAIVTTNGDGAVIKKTPANGWTYGQPYYGWGCAYYSVNGKPYTGWIGSYYIEDGEMAMDRLVEVNGKWYYFDAKGFKAKAGWVKIWESWAYANADGSLVINDWKEVNSKWYYFEEYWMLASTTRTINGETHTFDENGVWLGKNAFGTGDGWKSLNGDWYFIMAEQPVRDRMLFIDGAWYYFGRDGKMATNCFRLTESGCFYFTASGARANYVGWKQFNGKWVYFDNTHKVPTWVNENGKRYYIDKYGDAIGLSNGMDLRPGMVTGYQVIGGILYYFDNSGVLVRTVTEQGWKQVGADWYYVDHGGYVVCFEANYKIGNDYYAFDYNGRMVVKDVAWSWYSDSAYYCGADGKVVTKQGWYATADGSWVYVLADGTVAQNGVFKIDGKEYYFNNGYWVG